MRNLLIFVLVLIGVWWFRRALERHDGDRPPGGTPPRRDATPGVPERMIECAYCGVHVPESEGVRAGDEFYCCEAHRRLGPGR